jgi:hypothetical protein
LLGRVQRPHASTQFSTVPQGDKGPAPPALPQALWRRSRRTVQDARGNRFTTDPQDPTALHGRHGTF